MSAELSELLLNALNEQGYLFQEACEYALEKNEGVTKWEVKASEYPVSLEGQDTKVDIVLRSKIPSSPELYAVVECKRADPSHSYWLFGAPGLPFGGALGSTLGFECRVTGQNHPYKASRIVTQLHFDVNTYGAESWIEIKKNSTRRTSTPQNIENAFVQVLKGVGGLAQEQVGQRNKSRELFKTFFVPIVVTTAQLYVAYYEIKNIDLSTGKLSKDNVLFGPQNQPAQEVEWVLVDYGAGEDVAPEPIPEDYQGVDPIELLKYKIRSIFVVNSKSLVFFFSKLRLIQ
ncbi:MAG: hypothetical protein V3W44_08815 [Dehalococcoidales bacterium]